MIAAAHAEVDGGGDGGAGGDAESSASRSSGQQSSFRESVFLRDVPEGAAAACALCGAAGGVQAARIVPQGAGREEMRAAGLCATFDVRNGLLLCDKCHDYFDNYLWSIGADGRVVLSGALSGNVPSLAPTAGKKLFEVVTANHPQAAVWDWH
jgi:predicted restriction endonuclease